MMTEPVRDETGRSIAPPQTVIADRPMGAWDSNARADGSWAGPVQCGWCATVIRAGNPALETSHGLCDACAVTF